MREVVHPLTLFFQSRSFTATQGMDWLQGIAPEKHGRLISDLAIMPEDVCASDTDNVLRLAKAWHFIPASRRTAGDLAAMGVAK